MKIHQKRLRFKKKKAPASEDGSFTMNYKIFIRKPLRVQAVEITKSNIEEIAKYIGEIQDAIDGSKYIIVNRQVIPGVSRVYPGYWMTKTGQNIRVFSRTKFFDQFLEEDDTIRPMVDHMNKIE